MNLENVLITEIIISCSYPFHLDLTNFIILIFPLNFFIFIIMRYLLSHL